MGFMNKRTNWTEVDAAGTSSMLPAGGYVAKITDVEDVDSREYLRFTYDIAEGPLKGFFEDDDRPYTHQFVKSYTAKAEPFMAQFLGFVEASNANFKLDGWNNDPNDLIGKLVGIIVQRENYTNKDGEDRARMNVEGFASVESIRKGRYKLPDPKDTRAVKPAVATTQTASIYDADIPF